MRKKFFIIILLLALSLVIQWLISFTREQVVLCDGGEPWRSHHANI